ncbi:hypothetical protein PR048_002356 [Dryococelus australis]|uniref:Sulfhydryl oxidase n=1 Tax=Dryococelus australis TaxID=614101 RepID=A0ABQ9ILF3_9NEOP|nr:hypothetical protein PR048_002356 [Dryococelus australis]
MGVSLFPSIVVLDINTNVIPLKVSDGTRTTFRQAIKKFLEAHNIGVPKEQSIVDPGDWRHLKAPDLSEIIRAAEEEKKTQKINDLGDAVFRADLEKAVRYSLEHEVSVRKVISGAALKALQNYLTVLAKYFPVKSENGKSFFRDLRDDLTEVSDIEGETFLRNIKSAESEKGSPFLISSTQDWVGCKGSEENFRGFPCGLWMLFHMLTVNSVLEKSIDLGFNSMEVLDAMLGYITHFFGCQDCSRHFQQMALSMKTEVSSPNDSIMWLWKSHNKVNKRLAGDSSEDPIHPKIQFPSQKTCPACVNSDSNWNEPQVLQHLFNVYSRENISHVGLSEKSTVEAEDHRKKNNKGVAENHGGNNPGFIEMPIQAESFSRHFGWNFNIFDISLCVMLYMFSASICILVCIKFVMKKRYRKKSYVHDLFGKV